MNIKRIIKGLITVAKGEDTDVLIDVIRRNGVEVAVYHNDNIVASLGLSYAITYLDTNLNACIMVDDLFMELPNDLKSSIIEHEMGHIMLGHLEYLGELTRREKNKHNKSEDGARFEYEADLYSVLHSGKELADVLQIIMDSKVFPSKNNKLMKKRIKVIREM